MALLYDFSIRLMVFFIHIAALFKPKARKWVQGRKNASVHWPRIPENKKLVWFHCASLGEFDQGLPLMNRLKEADPELFLLVTFFSPSGMDHYHKRQHQVDYACYLPADTPGNARKFIAHFKPQQAFFVKYEFWCNVLLAAKDSGCELYSVCAIFRPDHRFFKWYGGFFRSVLKQFNQLFVQNQQSIDLLAGIGVRQATLVGDMRFDRVIANKEQVKADAVAEAFLKGEKAWIIGSSWPLDEEMLDVAIRSYVKRGKVILAPHDIGENHLKSIENRFGKLLVRYAHFTAESTAPILLIDSIGKLTNLYQYGSFAYVGGGFTGSLHNILEPGVFGLPVLFGPKHSRFPEGQLFVDHGVGFSFRQAGELNSLISQIEQNRSELQAKLAALIESQKGAAEKIAALV